MVRSKDRPDMMLDLETMGTGNDAAIIAIGAVMFDPEAFRENGDWMQCITGEFYVNVDLESSIRHGGKVTGATVEWWMDQSQEARDKLKAAKLDVDEALASFSSWVSLFGDPATVWGNGATFDNVVLRSAYDRMDSDQSELKCPWNFRADRCYRTLRNLAPNLVTDIPGLVTHYALDDAKYQAVVASRILSRFKTRGDAA